MRSAGRSLSADAGIDVAFVAAVAPHVVVLRNWVQCCLERAGLEVREARESAVSTVPRPTVPAAHLSAINGPEPLCHRVEVRQGRPLAPFSDDVESVLRA